MSAELLDDWDENFLEQAIKLELVATTTSTAPAPDAGFSPPRELSQRPVSVSSKPPDPTPLKEAKGEKVVVMEVERLQEFDAITTSCGNPTPATHRSLPLQPLNAEFSPPRKLMQRETFLPSNHPHRMPRFDDVGEMEMERFKKKERVGLQKGKAEGDAHLKNSFLQTEAKDAEIHILGTENLKQSLEDQEFKSFRTKRTETHMNGSSTALGLRSLVMTDNCATTSNSFHKQEVSFPTSFADKNPTRAIGIQVSLDMDCESASKDKFASWNYISSNLLAIWGSPSKTISGRNLVSRLFVSCSEDFCVLFGCMGMSSQLQSFPDEISFIDIVNSQTLPAKSVDAAKVSQLYAVLLKLNRDLEGVDSLLEALVDLCLLQNVLIVNKSLRILKVVLQMLLSSEMKSTNRGQNVLSQSNFVEETKNNNHIAVNLDFLNCNQDKEKNSTSMCISMDRRTTIVETMQKIAVRNILEYIRVQALSIMNLLVMSSDPILERENFGLILLTESFPKIMHKDVGVLVQKQALQLLFLLLNCPKLMLMFYSGYKDDINHAKPSGENCSSMSIAVAKILTSLSGCMTCGGKSIPELKLQRRAVILLALITSLGKPGVEILFSSVTPQGANFLELIIQVLALEVDGGAYSLEDVQEFLKESIALIREALILLNRLASNASVSKAVLGVLTSNTTSLSLVLDVANNVQRGSRRRRRHELAKNIVTMEDETIELARSLKARVLSFLGDNVS